MTKAFVGQHEIQGSVAEILFWHEFLIGTHDSFEDSWNL